jgi:NAD(P)-dependent dehydrogenase (short-subunit alcohol dehydrogenase family)
MAGRLQGKIALITGAARGIGEAIARAFADEGAFVLVTDLNDALGQVLSIAIWMCEKNPIGNRSVPKLLPKKAVSILL